MIAIPVSSYSISPAKWTIYLKEEYEMVDVSFPFTVVNDEDAEITVALEPIMPEKLYDGNTEIPRLDWVSVSEPYVVVPANSEKNVEIIIRIPEQYTNNEGEETSNYNQSYEVWFLADQTEGPGNIQVDYKARWTIQTPVRFVPLSERPGYVNPFLYVGIIGVVIAAIGVVVFVRKRNNTGNYEKDDIFN